MAKPKPKSSGTGVKVAAAIGIGLAIAGGTKHPHGGHSGHHHATLTAASPGTPSANRALADRMASHRGWGTVQQGCLNTLWDGESAFDTYNTYPSHDTPPSTPGVDITTAYGIPQALPAQKMAAAGPDWQTSAKTQIKWGLGYIQSTYGDPCSALAFKRSTGNQGY